MHEVLDTQHKVERWLHRRRGEAPTHTARPQCLMPPRKSAKRKQAPVTDDDEDSDDSGVMDTSTRAYPGGVTAVTSPFITRLSRQQLERLLQESVNSGVAPTLAGIKNLLPLGLRSQEVKKLSVAGGDERQVTQRRSNQALAGPAISRP